MNVLRVRFALAALMAFGAAASPAQNCQSVTAQVYGTYVDAQGQTRNLLLDLLIPTTAGEPTPVVVWVHGGGWQSGSRAPIPARAAALCERGYAVASIDYRLSGTAIWPAQSQDCKAALRWLRGNAATFNLDPHRFGVWGSSAGGHLVSFLGTTGGVGTSTVGNASVDLEGAVGDHLDQSSRVQAVVDWYGPTDLLAMRFFPGINHEAATSAESRLLGGTLPDVPELAATANPIQYLSLDDPPFLLMHGTEDGTVPFHQSELLHRALLARGLRATFVPILGAGHGGGNFDAQATLDQVYAFFDAQLLNLGAAVVSLTALDATVNENAGLPARFTLGRTGSTAAPLTVRLVASGSATLGTDYTAGNPTVTIPAGAAAVTVSATPVDDTLVEGNETITLTLGQATGYRLDAAATAASTTLVDNENAAGLPVVTVSVVDGVASESGPDGATLRITRTGSTAAALGVQVRWSGTATNGSDYAALPTNINLLAGSASRDVVINPVVDSTLETTETVILSVNARANYAVGGANTVSARLGELNQASTQPIVSAVVIDFDAAEAGELPGAFQLSRTGNTALAATYAVSPGAGTTTTDGVDHTALPLTVTFPSGVSRVTVPLAPFDDGDDEPNETVTLVADPAAGVLVGTTSAPVTVVDND